MSPGAQGHLAPGAVLDGRYRVVAPLGEGGMGAVYRVEHVQLGKAFALKVLRPELSALPELIARFEREARSAARLDDPRIVQVIDFGRTAEGAAFLVMELVEGRTLAARLAAEGPLPPTEAIALFGELLEGLAVAHEAGIVHRDLKPENVMLVARGGREQPKLLDFGLARIDGGGDPALTRPGAVFGSPRYMAPEQAAGEATDLRVDVYAVGVMLFEALSGRPLFVADTVAGLLRAHLVDAPPPLALPGAAPALAERLGAVVARALEKSPDARFGSARELSAALRGEAPALADTHVVRPSEAGPERAVQRKPRTRRVASGLLALLAVIAIGAIGRFTLTPSPATVLDEALQRGDLEAAREALASLEAAAPGDPRLLLGRARFVAAREHWAEATELGAEAVRREPSLAGDPGLADLARRLVAAGTELAMPLVRAVAIDGDASGVPLLVELVVHPASAAVRRRAFAGLERHGAVSRAPQAVGVMLADLEAARGETCELRKWYVERLVPLEDPRILPALRTLASSPGRGPFGLGRDDDCLRPLLASELARRGSR